MWAGMDEHSVWWISRYIWSRHNSCCCLVVRRSDGINAGGRLYTPAGICKETESRKYAENETGAEKNADGGSVSERSTCSTGRYLLDRTRAIFNGGEKSMTLNIANDNKQLPYLARAWVENEKKEKLPPARLLPHHQYSGWNPAQRVWFV